MPKFDGTDKVAFHRYKRKLLAYGGTRSGFDEALEATVDVSNPNAANYVENVKKRKLA